MFQLSLPVAAFAECLDVCRDAFVATVIMLGADAANLFVSGRQLRRNHRPDSAMGPAPRREMHLG